MTHSIALSILLVTFLLAGVILLMVRVVGFDRTIDRPTGRQRAVDDNDALLPTRPREAGPGDLTAMAVAVQTEGDQAAHLAELRDAYRHETGDSLALLDHRLEGLKRESHALSGAPKLELDARLKQIHANRIGVASDCLALEQATPSTWGEARRRLSTDLSELSALVDAA